MVMQKSKTITVGDEAITVSELTVDQVNALLTGFNKERAVHAAELLMDSALPIEAICAATGKTPDAFGSYAPSELELIWKATEEINVFLLRMLQRMVALGAKLTTGQGSTA